MLAVVLLAYLLQFSSAYTPDALADKITNLPGAEKLDITFNQFSGYIDIPGTSGQNTKHIHYWFVESMNNPTTDAVGFWTNGGPGCSGLLGFLMEQGPFRPNADMSLTLNEYAWNKVSNMIFVEQPAGVGFSYADDKADLTTGDSQAAIDNYNFLQGFFKRFPEYKNNDLFISSESYGGHYMPTLAKQIVDMNANASNEKLNFKGFAVGNPYTDPYSGTGAMIDTYWGHQLVAKPTYDEYVRACAKSKTSTTCSLAMMKVLNGVGNLNPYALDYPVCTADSKMRGGYAQRLFQLNHQLKAAGIEPKNVGVKSTGDYEPCEEDFTTKWINQKSVKDALHVKSTIPWEECSYRIDYSVKDSTLTSTAPIYNYLIDGGFGLNILVYSGDDDGVCATIGTQSWIWGLGYEVAPKPWSVYTYNQQTAGYLTQWKNTKLGFLTIRGAGHEVPTYKPDVALDMWKRYIAGEWTNK